jgi:DNA-binding NtrC family response regulator
VRVGSSAPIAVDVRLLAATNRDLEERVARGEFREDLYYRLSIMPIRVPSLRERPEDIPGLARALLARVCREYGQPPLDLAPGALDFLAGHAWRGNVRELENLLGRAVIHMRPGEARLKRSHFEPAPGPGRPSEPDPAGSALGFAERKRDWERRLLETSLARCGGNRAATAKSLGITVRNLYYKLHRHGLL